MWFKADVNPIFIERNNMKQEIILSSVERYDNIDFSYLAKKVLHREEYQYWLNSNEKRKNDYLFGRYSAKLAIQQKIYIDPNLININSGVFNFPLIKQPLIDYQISISHTKNIAVTLLSPIEQPMGIDIESLDRNMDDFIIKHLTNHEINLINKLKISLLIFWTAKESLSKAIKTGLTIELKLLEIKSVIKIKNHFEIKFTYFRQYKSVVWKRNNYFLSISLPKYTNIFL